MSYFKLTTNHRTVIFMAAGMGDAINRALDLVLTCNGEEIRDVQPSN